MNRIPPAPPKPTLEDLLRLKRAERPADEFWAEFERVLVQKQLAAIIEPKPWWLGFNLFTRRLASFSLPLGLGAAALLLGLVWQTVGFNGLMPMPVVPERVIAGNEPSPDLILAESSRVGAEKPTLVAEVAQAEVEGMLKVEVREGQGTENLLGAGRDLAGDAASVTGHQRQRETVLAATGRGSGGSAEILRDERESSGGQVLAALGLGGSGEQEGIDLAAAFSTAEGEHRIESSVAKAKPGGELELAPRADRLARLLALASPSAAENSALGWGGQILEPALRSLVESEALNVSSSRVGLRVDRLSLRF
jgi:hypothetical protein